MHGKTRNNSNETKMYLPYSLTEYDLNLESIIGNPVDLS